jgi:glycosyltransferase involved in cell wall biosynthesis
VEDDRMTTIYGNIKVGFVLPSGEWLGGRNYLRNLFAALQSVPGNPIEPVILTASSGESLSEEFPGISIIQTSMLKRWTPGWLIRKLISKTTSRDLLLSRVLERHGILLLSHCFHLGRQKSIKTIGWIPDFQHLHLPELFSSQEILHRNTEYLQLCQYCDKVILSSESVRTDLTKFSAEHLNKTELLQFVASPVHLGGVVGLEQLQKTYQFQGNYFLLPNQFWAHKNHRIVIEALRILKQRNETYLVLATGSTGDHRNPQFFPSLMRHVADLDVSDSFRVLGKIPFDHLVSLMHHTTAFINPSLFEGWSTSVEEAKSMGKQIVLSDLAVHREQAPDRAFFFPPNDANALAAALVAANATYDPDLDKMSQTRARAQFTARQRAFGQTYIDIVHRALAG